MIARTKNQKRVVSLNNSIKPLGKRIKKWAIEKKLDKLAIRYKSGKIHCLHCSNTWQSDSKVSWHDEIMKIKCSGCGHKVKVEQTNKRTKDDEMYFTQVTVLKEYQLIRTFIVYAEYKCNEKARYFFTECFRTFITEDGKHEVIGLLKGGMFSGYGNFWTGIMELRGRHSLFQKYSQQGDIYDKWTIQDYILQKGFNSYDYNRSSFMISAVFKKLLTDNFLETMWKLGWIKLFDHCLNHNDDYLKYKNVYRICMRHGYRIARPNNYVDMLQALEYFGKDLRNPKFICPENADLAHDIWTRKQAGHRAKIRAEHERQRNLEELAKMVKEKKEYAQRMKRFAFLEFKKGGLTIRPLMTIEEVETAGRLMKHCIYSTSSYWKNRDNLLLGCFDGKKLVETTQYSLSRKKVLHSYGKFNKISEHHEWIVETLSNNTKKILSCLKANSKSKLSKVPQLV